MSTNDTLQAVLEAQVMNLPCKVPARLDASPAERLSYKEGHRDARHAAAELVAEALSQARGDTTPSTGGFPQSTHALARIADPEALRALQNLLRYAERNTCTHEETHRGGSIWTICDSCGAKWADDEGGFPGFVEPPEFEQAREALAALAQPAQVAAEPVAVFYDGHEGLAGAKPYFINAADSGFPKGFTRYHLVLADAHPPQPEATIQDSLKVAQPDHSVALTELVAESERLGLYENKAQAVVLTDAEIIARCKAAGITWLAPDEEDAFPGMFDMAAMAEMRKLLAAAPAPAAADHVAATPEQAAEVDDSLGLFTLPPIRVGLALGRKLKADAEAKGVILQAHVRDLLTGAEAGREVLIEELCAAIKAADDKASENDYMLDSDDCIKVLRGQWNPAAPTTPSAGGTR